MPFYMPCSLAVLEEHAAALLTPATKYEVPLLVHRCTQQLIGAISLATVAHTLQAAVASDNQLLRKNCIAFIARNLAGVVVTEGEHCYTYHNLKPFELA
jgi:hypothetical protein